MASWPSILTPRLFWLRRLRTTAEPVFNRPGFAEAQNVGTCGFKAPALAHEAEIAYYTFPEFEGRGYARQAAQSLIGVARLADPDIVLTAQTLPADGPSPSILRKEGFINREIRIDPDAGEVWHWVLEPASGLKGANVGQL